jgi:tetratricopeptide (TPR) repeat protein
MSPTVEALWDVFEREPASDAAFLRLVQALSPQREHEQLVDLYRQRAEAVDTEQAVYLYLTIADVWSQRLGMPGLTTEALFSAYERDPSNGLIKNRLWLHLEQEQDWNTLARFLSTELRQSQDEASRGYVRLTFGHLLQRRLHDVAEAARMFRDAAQHPPLRGAALLALLRLKRLDAAQAIDFTSTLDHVRAFVGAISAVEDAAAEVTSLQGPALARALLDLARAATLHAERLPEVVGWLVQAVESDPSIMPEARTLLVSLLLGCPEQEQALHQLLTWASPAASHPLDPPAGAPHWRALSQILRMGPLLIEDPSARARLMMSIAAFEASLLSSPEQAARTYVAAATVSPEVSPRVHLALSALLERAPHVRTVRDALLEVLTASGQPSGTQLEQWQRLTAPPPPPTTPPPAPTTPPPAPTAPPPAPTSSTPDAPPAPTPSLAQTQPRIPEAAPVHPPLTTPEAIDAALRAHPTDLDGVERALLNLASAARAPALLASARALSLTHQRHAPLDLLLTRYAPTLQGAARTQSLAEHAALLAGPLHRPQEAAALYERLLQSHPQSAQHVTDYRKLLTSLDDLPAARRWLNTELRLVSHPAARCQVLIERALLEARADDGPASLLTLAEVFLIRPAHPRAHATLDDIIQAKAPLAALLSQKVPPLAVIPQAQRLRALGLALQAHPSHRAAGLDCLYKAFKLAPNQYKAPASLPPMLTGAGRDADAADVTQWISRQPQSSQQPPTFDLTLLSLFLSPGAEALQSVCDQARQDGDLLAVADLHLWASRHADWLDDAARDQLKAQAFSLYHEGAEPTDWLDAPTAPLIAPAAPAAPSAPAATTPARPALPQPVEPLGAPALPSLPSLPSLSTRPLTRPSLPALPSPALPSPTSPPPASHSAAMPTPLAVPALSLPSLPAQRAHDEDPSARIQALEAAIARDPLDEPSLAELEHLYRALPSPSKLVEVLTRRAALCSDDATKLALMSERARLLDEALQDPAAAIAALQQLLGSFPSHTPALEALADLYRRIHRYDDLLEVLSVLIQAQPERRFPLALDIAHLLEVHLSRPDDAFTQYRWAHDLDPDDQRPIHALWRLAQAHGLWAELVDFLEAQLSHKHDPDDQRLALDDLAAVTEHHLHDPVRAFHMRHMAWQLEPNNHARFQDLERLARQAHLWAQLATLYRALATQSPDAATQLHYLDLLSSLTAIELDDPDAAFEISTESLLLTPDPSERLAALRAQAHTPNQWAQLLDVLLERLQLDGDLLTAPSSHPSPAVEGLTHQQALLLECAQIAAEHLHDPSRAISLAIDAWLLAPTDTESFLDLLSRWQPDLETLAEHLLALASHLESASNAGEGPLIQAARLKAITSERLLQDPISAMRALCEALDQVPHSPLLTSLLLSLASRHGLLPELIHTADARIRQAPSSSLWLQVKSQAEATIPNSPLHADTSAGSLQISLESPHAAYRSPAPQLPPRRVSRPSTANLSASGVHNDAIQRLRTLESSLQAAQDTSQRIERTLLLAHALCEDAARADAATELLLRAHAQHPNDLSLRWALASLLTRARRWTQALPLYQALYDEGAVLVTSSHLASWRLRGEQPNDAPQLIIGHRLARCMEHDPSQNPASLSLYQSLLAISPDHPLLLAGVARCSYRAGAWDQARALLEALLLTPDGLPPSEPDALSELYFAYGDILHAARQLDDARDAFERALSFDADFRPAADQLLAILIEQRRWDETIPAFDRLLRLTFDPDEQGAIFKRLGEVYEHFLDQHDKAIAAYEQAVVLGGDTDDVPPLLLRLYVKHDEWEKARIIAEILLERAPRGTALRVELLLVLGDILWKGLNQTGASLDAYQQALGLDPENILALDRAATVMIKQRNLGGVHGLYQQFLKRIDPKDMQKRVEVLGRYGKQLLVMGESPERGLEIFKGLADLVPNDVDIHTQLFNIFSGQGMHNPAAELVHLRKLVSLKQIRFEYIQHIAELYEQLNEREGAAEVRTLLALACGEHPPVRSTPATPRLEFDRGALTGDNYEHLIADPYSVGPLARFFERLYKLGLGELGQQVEFSGLMSVAELTRLSSTPASERFNRLCEAMNLGKRRLFIRSDLGQQYQVLASSPPAIAIGEQLVQDRSEDEWRFILARTLELSRPRFLLSSSLGAFSFVTVLRTLLKELSSDQRDVPVSLVDPDEEERVMRFLSELRMSKSIEVQEDLQSLVDQIFLSCGDEGPSAKRYAQAARATSVRMGLLVCNDQRIALDYLLREEHGQGLEMITDFDTFASLVERSPDLQALVSYVISEEYLSARRALNLPRTQLSNIIKLPASMPGQSGLTKPPSGISGLSLPPLGRAPDKSSDAQAPSMSLFSSESGVNSLFGDEINDLIDALPIDEMIPSSGRQMFNDRAGSDASSRALDDVVDRERPKRRR